MTCIEKVTKIGVGIEGQRGFHSKCILSKVKFLETALKKNKLMLHEMNKLLEIFRSNNILLQLHYCNHQSKLIGKNSSIQSSSFKLK